MRKITLGFDSFELDEKQDDAINSLLEGQEIQIDSLSANDKNIIGLCYYYGLCLEQDYSQAVHWYSLAADEGWAAAEKNLAVCYKKGHGVGTDLQQAAFWYERAAEHGQSTAQCNIAEMYYKGCGVKEDKEKAWYWLEKAMANAIEINNMDLLNYIGDMYRYGDSMLEQDYEKAAEFYRKASKAKNPLSMMNLASMIYLGEIEGTSKEVELLLTKAAKTNLPFALAVLEDLAKDNMIPSKYYESLMSVQETDN